MFFGPGLTKVVNHEMVFVVSAGDLLMISQQVVIREVAWAMLKTLST